MMGPAKGLWVIGTAVLAGLVFLVADQLHGGDVIRKRRKATSELARMLASELHEDWRRPRYRPATRDYEPRLKTTHDEAWIRAHGGATEVDIANTFFFDLPADWQQENLASAEVALAEIERASRTGRELDTSFTEDAARTIHDRWLERNRATAPPEQNVPYEQLSEGDKDKDRAIVRIAIGVWMR